MFDNSTTKNYSFCTFFDLNYLPRGLALIESLRRVGETNQILVVCLDDETSRLLQPLSGQLNLQLVNLETIILEYPELSRARADRTKIEFYFTCTPFILKFGLVKLPQDHVLIYLDADLFFFDSMQSVLEELGTASVGIIRHNYPKHLDYLAKKYGTFNVGLMLFKNDKDGNKTINWWATQCLTWCHDYPEAGKYADQGYLDQFSSVSSNLNILTNPGFNLAPWNSSTNSIRVNQNKIWVGRHPLVFFHFHNLKLKGNRWFSPQLNYFNPMRKKTFKAIYLPYLRQLEKSHNWAMQQNKSATQPNRKGYGIRGIAANLARYIFFGLNLVMGQTVSRDRIEVR